MTYVIVVLLACLYLACLHLFVDAYHMSSECMSDTGERIYCHPDTERCDYTGVGCRCQLGAFPYPNYVKGRDICIRDSTNQTVFTTNLVVFTASVDIMHNPRTTEYTNVECMSNLFDGVLRYQCSSPGNLHWSIH
jgi:hypothetical protein